MSALTFTDLENTVYRKIDTKPVVLNKNGFLEIPDQVFTDLAFEAFKDVSHLLRSSHLAQLRKIFDDKTALQNERFVALQLLKNANIASDMALPLCQDTGTAYVLGKKGHLIVTTGLEESALSIGIKKAYTTLNLRFSQNKPISFFQEQNTKTNLPALIDLNVATGNEYNFLFMAKGGGSANKTALYQQTPALLNEPDLVDFLVQKIKEFGVSACPPYHIAVVVGGLSAEQNLKAVKLASAHALDTFNDPFMGFRDTGLELKLAGLVNKNGLGAQFGGVHFCLDMRVIRLARHGASLPIGIGVSCVADRNIYAKITSDGAFLECLEKNPAQFLPEEKKLIQTNVSIDLNAPIEQTLECLTKLPVGSRLLLNGTLIVARDLAHARFKKMLDEGKRLPSYLKKHPIYYAGPARKPDTDDFPCGSFGPTTAGRMDSYMPLFQSLGGALITIAKGNRSKVVVDSCQKYGGFYLGTVGGAAALTALNITSCECIDFDDLGMEAVYKITVKDMPVFVLIDDKGSDFYNSLSKKK